MAIKKILLLIIMFLIINFSSYYLTKTNTDNIVKIILQEKLNILSTHYGILLETQKRISNFSYNPHSSHEILKPYFLGFSGVYLHYITS